MISKQRGFIDPWSLGFLISLAGLAISQPWDRASNDPITATTSETEKVIVKTDGRDL